MGFGSVASKATALGKHPGTIWAFETILWLLVIALLNFDFGQSQEAFARRFLFLNLFF
jgi:hypothetical protein